MKWNVVIQCVSDDKLKTKLEREVENEEPSLEDIEYWEKYYTTEYDPYSPQQQWTATVISVYRTAGQYR